MAEGFMQPIFAKFRRELYDNGCLEVEDLPEPNLKNRVLPMFAIDRWAKGHDQSTGAFYYRLDQALRMASLMLSEDCMLAWFVHLTFGSRKYDDSHHPPKVYIGSTRLEHSSMAREDTKRELRKLGEVITLMFTPREYRQTDDGKAYGVTAHSKSHFPWSNKYRGSDWPYVDGKYRSQEYQNRYRPCIAMNSDFQDFFMNGWKTVTAGQRFRTLFVFAETLVHEVAHAYYLWLGRPHSSRSEYDEPFWNKEEKTAELGFSWETVTLGRIMNPLMHDIKGCKVLCSFQAEQYDHDRDRKHAMKAVIGQKGLKYSTVPMPNQARFQVSTMRGHSWFCKDGGRKDLNMIAAIHGIPLKWIAHWFQEDEWNQKRRTWRHYQTYTPPSLGPTFMLIYERDKNSVAALHMPANARADADGYLDTVRAQTTAMHLYGHDYAR